MLNNRIGGLLTIATSLLVSLAACNTNADTNQTHDQRIINVLRLPKDAYPIQKYSRYFVNVKNSRIEGVLVVHSETHKDDIERGCKEVGNPPHPCKLVDFGIASPNTTKWVNALYDLPAQNGGGCSYIRLTYDIKLQRIVNVKCNGSY
jgi:hypothetical protein